MTTLAPKLKGSLRHQPLLDSWIRVDGNGDATVFTGKAELGQGIRTALIQIAAEELDLPANRIKLITADTNLTPNEGLTAGSHSLQDSGAAVQNAAANVRLLLIQKAAETWRVGLASITTTGNGNICSGDGRTTGYGTIARTLSLHVPASPDVALRDPNHLRIMGTSMRRVDVPAKLTGGSAFVQDMRLPGMLHARVVRGPSEGTVLQSPNLASVQRGPGGVKVVQLGGFVAVVAEEEWTVVTALRSLQGGAFTRAAAALPIGDVVSTLKGWKAEDIVVLDTRGRATAAAHTVTARYTRPWLCHGSIGPSCAVAIFKDGLMTVWSHSQGIFGVRRVVAELVNLPPEKVHVIHTEGAGCYGQNGADDAAADAALIAKAIPGIPIRLQWMRDQEFGWEPLGPAMVTELQASLDAKNSIISWRHEIWSNRHNARPEGAGGVFAGNEIEPPFPRPKGRPLAMPEGDADRNSNPLYALPNMFVIFHYLPDMPIRVSALRSLGAHVNVFAIESMFDELARAGDVDPLTLRLDHTRDERARAVMHAAAARFGWSNRRRGDGRRGAGFAFARYKNLGAYLAVAMEIEVDRATGNVSVIKVCAAVDSGQVVNPDGIRNQIEGGIIQSLSWTTREAVTFDKTQRTSLDWNSYPILRFSDTPSSIEIQVMARPGQPFLGTAEAAQGPTGAAFANALADATGIRLRDMPLSPERIKAAIGEAA